jgi:septum formation protein
MKIIFGSSSKWRRQVIEREGLKIDGTMSPDIDEDHIGRRQPLPGENIVTTASILSSTICRAKADALVDRFKRQESDNTNNNSNNSTINASEPVFIITSDQVVACDGAIREKPKDANEARQFLKSYQTGSICYTITAVQITNARDGSKFYSDVDVQEITFDPFPDSSIDGLIAKGEIFTCSGGFVCEDPLLAPYIHIQDTTSVMGMPIKLLRSLLAKVDTPPHITPIS